MRDRGRWLALACFASALPASCIDNHAAPECADGMVYCDAVCASLRTDRRHCGDCGHRCGFGERCEQLVCVPALPYILCDGQLVDTDSDPRHCGGCSRPCGDGSTCREGDCESPCGCPAPLACCPDGSCILVSLDEENCGDCGHVCPHGQTCLDGECACPRGQLVCGDLCVYSTNDSRNCGGCGRVVPIGTICLDGVPACPRGRVDCDPGPDLECVFRGTATDCDVCDAGRGCPEGSTCSAEGCVSSP